MESFLREVFLDDGLGMVFDVRCHLTALSDACFYLDLFAFAFLESFVLHFAHARPLLEDDDEPYFVSFDLACFDLHVGEQALFPEALDGFGDLRSGYFDLVAYGQAGEADQHEVFVTVRSLHLDTGDLIGLVAREAVLDLLSR